MSNQPTLRAELLEILETPVPIEVAVEQQLELILSRLPEEHVDNVLQQSYKLGGTDVPSFKRGYLEALNQVRAILKGKA